MDPDQRSSVPRCSAYGMTFQHSSPDHLNVAHIGRERIRHVDGAVFPLIILQDRDERPPDGETRPVQRVNELGALFSFLRKRAFMRRAWKSPQLEQEEISR